MFGMNKKTARKLETIIVDPVSYDQDSKTFSVITTKDMTREKIKEIKKLGLEISGIYKTENANGNHVYFKRKSYKPALLIGIMGIQIILFGYEMLFLGFHTYSP